MRLLQGELPPIPKELYDEAEKLGQALNTRLDESLLVKLSYIYDYLDSFNESYLKPMTSCNISCCHCCKIDVHITQAEAEFIHRQTGHKISIGRTFSHNNTTACPFLSGEGCCTIYDSRPLPCRMYHVTGDPNNCEPGKIRLEYGSPANNFGNTIFLGIVGWVYFNNSNHGGSVRDIRDYFPDMLYQ